MSKAKREPCPNCPFRRNSAKGYDQDAMIAFKHGNEPECHAVVGAEAIFINAPMTPEESTACIGYRLWLKGVKGFIKPKLAH